jgi:hypothetical protein
MTQQLGPASKDAQTHYPNNKQWNKLSQNAIESLYPGVLKYSLHDGCKKKG